MRELNREETAAKAIQEAISGLGDATFDEIVQLYMNSFVYTSCTLFMGDRDKMRAAIEHFQDHAANLDPKGISEIKFPPKDD